MRKTNNLSGKIALVTGASRGIGAAIAVELAKNGADVIINYHRSRSQAEEVQEKISATGVRSMLVQADVGRLADIRAMFNRVETEWGPVDILVNNAGVERRKSSLDLDESDYDWMMNINLKGAFFCAQRALRSMLPRNWGRIINISSVHEVQPTGFCSIYSMTKGGMLMMTRELAFEFSRSGITINNIAPGAIRTDMNRKVLANPEYEANVIRKIPARMIGEPRDVAGAVAFLASEEARYITGASLFVDGGLVL